MNSSLGMNGSLPRRNSYNKSWTRFRSPAPPQGRVPHLSRRIWDNPTPASSQLPRWGSFEKSSTHTCFRLGSAGEMGQFPTFSSLKIPSGWLVQMRFPFWGCSVQAYFFRDYYDSVREGKKEGRVVRLPISKGNFLELTGLKRWNSSR